MGSRGGGRLQKSATNRYVFCCRVCKILFDLTHVVLFLHDPVSVISEVEVVKQSVLVGMTALRKKMGHNGATPLLNDMHATVCT